MEFERGVGQQFLAFEFLMRGVSVLREGRRRSVE